VGLLLGLIASFGPSGAEARTIADGAPPQSKGGCSETQDAVELLVCHEPSLAALDTAVSVAFRDYRDQATRPPERDSRIAGQRLWLDGRAAACPSVRQTQPDPRDARHQIAVACLSRIYEQRLAVLSYEHNTAAWPHIRSRPILVEGAGTKLCEDLQQDLVASFLGPAQFVNPLGEREIGFALVAGLGDDPMVLRADIDAYNLGKPFPILQWVEDNVGLKQPTAEYRAFASPEELLSAVGRGLEPLARSVRDAAHPVIDVDRLPRPDPAKSGPEPRAAFAGSSVLAVDEMPRFFRHEDRVYVAGPMRTVPNKPGDLGIYRLYGPAQLHRVCLFDAHLPIAHFTDKEIELPQVAEMLHAAGTLSPTGRLCAGTGDEARMLADQAAWRPWTLEQRQSMPSFLSGEQLALYMRNRALTGPEETRQYRTYVDARTAAIEALAPFYQREFGRIAAEAERVAALYLDQKVLDGFDLDPDDDSAAALFASDYARRHVLQRAALAGDTAALRDALGDQPKLIAKDAKGDLDEPLVGDAIEHPETLRALLDLGLDPNEKGASGRTPLMVAARLDLVEAAEILLAHGAVIDTGAGDAVAQTDSAGDPLCTSGEAAAADTPGRTALSYAAELGSPEMIRLLIDHGADRTARDSAGRRAEDYLARRAGDPAQSAEIAEILK
jgi:ankyrin repeat protein/uncharacterized protein YecT (DUF1311 family)